MFDLKFFKLVSNVLNHHNDSTITILNTHQQYIMKRGIAAGSRTKYLDEELTEEQRMMAFYIFDTYPSYFDIELKGWEKISNHLDRLCS